MVILIKLWREILICALIFTCMWIIMKNQDLRYELKETIFIHEKLVKDAKLNSLNVIATAQRQRQLDAEQYANQIIVINDKYASFVRNGNRMQQETTTYHTRLHTITRETLEGYAKTGSLLYGECRNFVAEMGRYTASIDAELDSKTKAP